MEQIFVDTNVILDILQQREGMLDALRMIMFARKQQLGLVTSTLSLMNVGYALRHQYKGAALCKVLDKLDETIKPKQYLLMLTTKPSKPNGRTLRILFSISPP